MRRSPTGHDVSNSLRMLAEAATFRPCANVVLLAGARARAKVHNTIDDVLLPVRPGSRMSLRCRLSPGAY